MAEESKLITAAEASLRLGVKPTTLYAYVSRGVVRSHRLPGARGSWFDPAQIDDLAGGRGRPSRPRPDLDIESAISRIDGRSLAYRSHDAVELSRRSSFEAVAALLWEGQLRHERFDAPKEIRRAAQLATRWLGVDARLADRLVLAVAAAATADPLRFDLSPAAVGSVGRVLIATVVDSLPLRSDGEPPPLALGGGPPIAGTIAGRLWRALAPGPPPEQAAAVLNGFLVLLADHELATSTLAARVAASTRANPYSAITAALGALDGPLHGTVSEEVHALLVEASGPAGATGAVADRLRRGQRVPGFGQLLYVNGDPRATAGLQLLRRLDRDTVTRRRLRIVERVRTAAGARTPAFPNSDFSLGALAFVAGMPPDAGEAIFAVARIAGWIAHVLEEYGEPPLRFRVRALYTGREITSG